MGLRVIPPTDATDSWAGYLYQSALGLVVTLEKILWLQGNGQPIMGHFAYEDIEDFSIYIKDASGTVTDSSTYQSKYKKGTTPSLYYDFFRLLGANQSANPSIKYFLNISANINFDSVNAARNNLPPNFTSFLYRYRNGQRYLGGTECLMHLEQLILDCREQRGLDTSSSAIERITSALLAFVDTIIIRTKEERITNPTYRKEIAFSEIIDLVANTDTTLTQSVILSTLRKRFLRAFMIYSEVLDEQEAIKVDAVAKLISEFNQDEFISFVKKIQMHKDLTRDVDLVSSFNSPEELQEILFAVAKAVSLPLETTSIVFKKKLSAYRPSTLRSVSAVQVAHQNLKLEYIPKIIKNMSEHDIEGLFETKKIIIDGQTINDIWSFAITSSESEKRENKINEPELKTLISVQDAIGELNEDT